LEMLIAMALIVLVISAVLPLVSGGQSVTVSSETNQEALYKAQQQIETARATARDNFYDPSLNFGTTVTQDSDVINYTKSLTVSADPANTNFSKVITSKITWGTAGQQVTLSTIVSDWQSSLGGDLCSPTLTGDWTAPQVYGYVDFASSAGATGVDIRGIKAYITSNPSSAGTDDFYVVNVSDPRQQPLPIIGSFSTSYGLTDVVTVGTYSYVTADSAAYQLLVIDVSDPTTLNTSKIKAKRDVTATGDTAIGNTLFYADKKLYIGLTKSGGPEFHIFDVSNPINPVEIGSGYEVGAAINRIIVKNNIAYLAVASGNEVIALDVSNPSNPSPISTFASAAPPFGQSIVLDKGTTLYFGRTGPNVNPKLLALDSTNLSAAPKWTMDMDRQSGIFSMILRSNLLFITTSDPNDGLQIWDVSNPSGPPVRYDSSPLNVQQSATAGSNCAGNLLYVAQRSNRAMQIVGPYIPAPFDYAFSTPPADVSLVRAGSPQNTSFTITRTSGTTQPVNFTNSVLPTGVTMSYSATSCSPNCTTTLTLSATAGASLGTTPITISGDLPSHSTSFNLTVSDAFDYTLTNSGPLTIPKNSSKSETIIATLISGATTPVTLTVSGLPAHVSLQSIAPASCGPTCSSAITIRVQNSATSGTYPITVTGSPQGTGPRTTNFNLIIP